MKRAALLLVLFADLAFAQNQVIKHTVRDGDSLSILAAEFYGDRKKAILIMVENKIEKPRPLRNGERLKIPIAREITTSPGDTFETLASTHLANPQRGGFLAQFNNMSPDDYLPAGTPLLVPFTIVHKAEATESLAAISATFLGDKAQADLLRRYNSLEKNTLDKDESIQIPVFNAKVPAAKMPAPDAESKARREERRAAVQGAQHNLPKAWQAWRTGEAKQIGSLLDKIDIDYLDTTDAVDVALLRGLAAVAENKPDAAKEHFKAVLGRKPSHLLRKFDYSPKILELWKSVEGTTD